MHLSPAVRVNRFFLNSTISAEGWLSPDEVDFVTVNMHVSQILLAIFKIPTDFDCIKVLYAVKIGILNVANMIRYQYFHLVSVVFAIPILFFVKIKFFTLKHRGSGDNATGCVTIADGGIESMTLFASKIISVKVYQLKQDIYEFCS